MQSPPRILKGAAAPPTRRIEAAVWDADRRVRETAALAAERARRALAETEAQRARLVAEARAEGRREGAARAGAALALAAAERDRILAGLGGELAVLALAIARKVLGRELAAPGSVAALAEEALREARERRVVVLRVSPGDAAEIRAAGGRLAGVLARAPVDVREDDSLEAGAVVVETEAGRIDARIEAQLEALGRALAEALP